MSVIAGFSNYIHVSDGGQTVSTSDSVGLIIKIDFFMRKLIIRRSLSLVLAYILF